jgi:hypothetical protein
VQKLETISWIFSKLNSWDRSYLSIVTLLSKSMWIMSCFIFPNYWHTLAMLSFFSLFVNMNRLIKSCWRVWWYDDFFNTLIRDLKSFSRSSLLSKQDLMIDSGIFFSLFREELLFLSYSLKYLDFILSIPSRYSSILFCLIKSSMI